ncbi:MAG: hypothetical protein GXP35_13465 [Actinobacteria bacterium]|nr:hypothetical protein [Actinomycetota bacterium]
MNENAMHGTNEILVDGDESRPAVDGWRCETAGDWQHSYDFDALMIDLSSGETVLTPSNYR